MSLPSTQATIKNLIQSIRMFLSEFEARNDIDEIRAAESGLWSVAMDAETRRSKTPPIKCPRVTRIEI